MGKKAKIGKHRKDKYYHLAKESGYRSRSAFKLIQLNRKFEFLQKSRVLIDLCAAPGGWLQVATKCMPVSSVVLGVDLYPIRPIPRVTTLVADITTEKCKMGLKKELHGWKADCVLHDGAPNVGANWLLDAHTQARLTLQSLKLACVFLTKGGCYVTKIFRSRDYQSLIWVFHQLFRKIHATKPQASRNESAEIFVVCQGYISPDKIDPKFFDPKYIFKELPVEASDKKPVILQDPTKLKKVRAEGYIDGEMSLHHKVNMSDFLNSEEPVAVLSNCSELIFDIEDLRFHRLTTDEIRECVKDIKVLGRGEIRILLTWHKNMRKVLENAVQRQSELQQKEEGSKNETGDNSEEDDEDDEELKKTLEQLKESDRLSARRKKKTTTKKKRKIREKLQRIGTMQEAMEEEAVPDQELSLFKLSNIKSKTQLTVVEKDDLSFLDKDEDVDEELEEELAKIGRSVKFVKKRLIDPDDPDDVDSSDDDDSDEDLPSDLEDEEKELLKKPKSTIKPKQDDDSDLDSDLDEGEEINPLMVDLDDADAHTRVDRRTSFWFSKDAFSGIEEENDEDMEITQMTEHYENIGGSIQTKSIQPEDNSVEAENDTEITSSASRRVSFNTKIFSMDELGKTGEEDLLSDGEDEGESKTPAKNGTDDTDSSDEDDDDDESSDDSDYDDNVLVPDGTLVKNMRNKSTVRKDGFEIVASQPAPKLRKLDPAGLALGTLMATSKKKRREIIEHSYNRYSFGDEDVLPSWFALDEKAHCCPILPITKEMVSEYNERLKEINARPIKKVIQAKARKKIRQVNKLEKIRKKAESIGDTVDTSEKEKLSQIRSLYKKAGLDGKRKKNITYIVAKKGARGKRVRRPRGVHGPFRVVDKRMKTDTRGRLANEARKKKMKKKRR